jgi:hypothetical protein
MKYVMLLVRNDTEWEALGEEGQDYGAIMQWWADLAQSGRLLGGDELAAVDTATTVSWEDGRVLVTDGPFMEAKESIGGFGIIDVPDLDAALAIARSWPARAHKVEVRPARQR